MSSTFISKYRKFTFSLCQELSTENLDSLKYLLRDVLTMREIESISCATDLLVTLEQRNKLGSNNWHLLEDLLTQIKRQDLVKKLRDFQRKQQRSCVSNDNYALSEVCVANKENVQPDCVTDGEGGVAEKMLSKNEKVKLGEITTAESSEPLLGWLQESAILACSGQEDTKKVSKPLRSLLDDGNALQEICEHLDKPVLRCGHYREVAQYYKFDQYQISSVLEKYFGGPTRALIESLAATYTDLTVEEFASVVGKKTQRNDVIELLRAYDLAEDNNL